MQNRNNPIEKRPFFIIGSKTAEFLGFAWINCYYDTHLNLQGEKKI